VNLNVSSLFVELALIFLPGFVWLKIHMRFGAKGETPQFDMILNAFLFGVTSYLILYGIYAYRGATLAIMDLDTNSTKIIDPKIFKEILYAIAVAIIGSILTLYAENYKVFTWFVQKIRATKRFGDEDVWDFVFNSSSKSVNYVFVRDFEQRVVYAGYVDLFSETGQLRELVLSTVTVYDFESVEMYQMPRVYLARSASASTLSFLRSRAKGSKLDGNTKTPRNWDGRLPANHAALE
jgi:hypothetical protein